MKREREKAAWEIHDRLDLTDYGEYRDGDTAETVRVIRERQLAAMERALRWYMRQCIELSPAYVDRFLADATMREEFEQLLDEEAP